MLSRISIACVPLVRRSGRDQPQRSGSGACAQKTHVSLCLLPEFGSSSFAAMASKLCDAMIIMFAAQSCVSLSSVVFFPGSGKDAVI
jgi:hypothetical protein